MATMAPHDRVEILAGADWAFGDGAGRTPLKLISSSSSSCCVRDWAAGVEVFGADRVDDDDDDVLRRELELAAERRERGDSREETVEEKALLDDMEEDLLDDVVPDDKEPERQTYWPTGGSIDGETPERWLWRETPERMEVDRAAAGGAVGESHESRFGSQKLSVSLEDDASSRGPWRAPSSRASAPGPSPKKDVPRGDPREAKLMIRRRWARPFKRAVPN